MAATRYRFRLLRLPDCAVVETPARMLSLLQCWRKSHTFAKECSRCRERLPFSRDAPYTTCCQRFYYDKTLQCYPVRSIAVESPGYEFLLPQLKKMIVGAKLQSNQEYVVFPDPVYWQVRSTLVYDKVLKFIQKQPVTSKTETVLPPEKALVFFKQLEETPLNYCSMHSRSCGKATQIRQVSFGKRCVYSARGMIVPDPSLAPNEIRLPAHIVDQFRLDGKWVYVNRMPSLTPGSFVALRVKRGDWTCSCFGVPLEILKQINGDFDGDEVNVYFIPNAQSQAECAYLLNPEWEMGCFVSGTKLAPSQDMLVAYHLFYDAVDFLPYKSRDLAATFRVIYELYGSKAAFRAVDAMRLFYLDALQKKTCFALTLEEMDALRSMAEGVPFETFRERAASGSGCLVTQVLAGAKGSFEHLYQMFGSVGWQGDRYVESSYWNGLTPVEAVAHARTSYAALSQSGKIWQPGYGYTKIAYNIHDIKVDYWGRLMDGDRVVERDALDGYHCTDVLSEETFRYLLKRVLVGGVKIKEG